MSKIKEFIAKHRIPKNTPYCQHNGKVLKKCPYWQMLKYKDSHGDPIYYCKYLKVADIYQGETLLWDQCKECGINDDWNGE